MLVLVLILVVDCVLVNSAQHLSSAVDSLSVCAFIFGASFQLYDANQLVEVVNAVTGWDTDMTEILAVGERRLNMLRAFSDCCSQKRGRYNAEPGRKA